MKILLMCLGIYSRVGGIERFIQRVVQCVSELSGCLIQKSVILSLWDTKKDIKNVSSPHIRFIPLNSNKVRAILAFIWYVLKIRPDVILYGHVLLLPLAVLSRLLNPKSRQVLFAYGFEVWGARHCPQGYQRPGILEVWVVRRLIHLIISISDFTTNQMKKAFKIEANRFIIIPCGVDVADRKTSDVPLSFEGDYRLLTVSRLGKNDWYKGCHRVIKALPLVLKVFPNTHYYIVGDGPLKKKLQNMAIDIGIAQNIHFLGYVDDKTLEQIYNGAHIFIMPSTGEGFGIVFLEAWKHRLPVIAGNRDASAEVVSQGVNGLLIDPENSHEITQAVMGLLSNPQEATRLGEAGYQTILKKYTHKRFRERFLSILLDIYKI